VSILQDSSMSPNDASALQLKSLLADAQQLSKDLLHKWNLGHCHDGVLVLFSTGDNVLYTTVDSAARATLTDDLVGEISANVKLDFGRNVSVGVAKLLASFKAVFLDKYIRTTNWDNNVDAKPVLSSATSHHAFHPITAFTLIVIACFAKFAMRHMCLIDIL